MCWFLRRVHHAFLLVCGFHPSSRKKNLHSQVLEKAERTTGKGAKEVMLQGGAPFLHLGNHAKQHAPGAQGAWGPSFAWGKIIALFTTLIAPRSSSKTRRHHTPLMLVTFQCGKNS